MNSFIWILLVFGNYCNMEKKTYRIIGTTNSWIAQRDAIFNGKTKVIINKGMTLKQARKRLLKFFCLDYEVYFPNWGVARHSIIGRNTTLRFKDGTYSYEFDSRTFAIEREEEGDIC